MRLPFALTPEFFRLGPGDMMRWEKGGLIRITGGDQKGLTYEILTSEEETHMPTLPAKLSINFVRMFFDRDPSSPLTPLQILLIKPGQVLYYVSLNPDWAYEMQVVVPKQRNFFRLGLLKGEKIWALPTAIFYDPKTTDKTLKWGMREGRGISAGRGELYTKEAYELQEKLTFAKRMKKLRR